MDATAIGTVFSLGTVLPGRNADPGIAPFCGNTDLAIYQQQRNILVYVNTLFTTGITTAARCNQLLFISALGLAAAPLHIALVRTGGFTTRASGPTDLIINGVPQGQFQGVSFASGLLSNWNATDRLRLGPPMKTQSNGCCHTWNGTVYFTAFYNRSLSSPLLNTPGEVLTNFNAWLPNSKPVLTTASFRVSENVISPLQLNATDFDITSFNGYTSATYASASTQGFGTYTKPTGLTLQTLTYTVVSVTAAPGGNNGKFYRDAAGTTQITTFPAVLVGTRVYYRPKALYIGVAESILVTVSDGTATSDTKTLVITVGLTDFPPLPTNQVVNVVFGVNTVLALTGTDVNGAPFVANFTCYIASLPATGSLYQMQLNGTLAGKITSGQLPAKVKDVHSGVCRVTYVSGGSLTGDSGLRVVATDKFKFNIKDFFGLQSTWPGNVTVQVINNLRPNEALQFGFEDFVTPIYLRFNDTVTGPSYSIQIVTLPTKGKLFLHGTTTLINGTTPINVTSPVDYLNNAGEFGTPFDSLQFQVFRGPGHSWASYVGTIPIAINQSNHAPVIHCPTIMTVNIAAIAPFVCNVTDPDPPSSTAYLANMHVSTQIALISLNPKSLDGIAFDVGNGKGQPDQIFLANLTTLNLAMTPFTLKGEVFTTVGGFINITVTDNDRHYPGPITRWLKVKIKVTNTQNAGGLPPALLSQAALIGIWFSVAFVLLLCCGLCIYCNIILPRRLIKGAKNAVLGATVGKYKVAEVKQSHRLTRGKPPYAMLNQH